MSPLDRAGRVLARALRPDRDRLTVSLAAVVLALAFGFALIYATGRDGVAGYGAMFSGGLGGVGPLGETSVKTAVLIFTGLSVAIAFTVGLFNIGAEGQFIVGAVTAAWLGSAVRGLPAGVHLTVALTGAALAGAAYGLVPAWLKVARGVHEVISTIMLNWVAINVVENWLVIGPLKAQVAPGSTLSLPGTREIETTAHLPRLLGEASRMNLGIVLAAAAVLAVWVLLSRTRLGYELRAVGTSPEAARYGGVDVARTTYFAMATAGALAALAGATLILGTEFRYPSAFHAGYGFDGIAVALIGGNHPVGVAVSAAFFGALRAGGTRLQLLQIHRSLPEVIEGMALVFVAGHMAFRGALVWLRSRGSAQEGARDA